MSNLNDHAAAQDLSTMGFNVNHINRAFKIYKKNYGTVYNLSVLTEIVIRLQSKDNQKRHSNFQYMHKPIEPPLQRASIHSDKYKRPLPIPPPPPPLPNHPPPKILIQNDMKTPPLPINEPIKEYNFNSDGDDDVDNIDFDMEIDKQLQKQCINIKRNNRYKHRYSLQNHINNKPRIVAPKRKSEIISRKCNNNVISDEDMIDKIIGKHQYKLWNFENERVNNYRYKCCNVKYENILPKLYDIIYPSILSNIILSNDNIKYKMNILFDTKQLKQLSLETHIIIKTSFIFDLYTKTQNIIDCVLTNIENNININHKNINIEWDNLYKTCFMLKIENREEYLKYSDNYKIINLNYIRECIRNNSINNVEFVLIYCAELYNYSDYQYRLCISNANKRRKIGLYNKLKYENMGFNSILNTLHILHKKKRDYNDIENEFEELMKCVNDEIDWLKNKINRKQRKDEIINYNIFGKEDAILLNDFDHRIEISICEISNIKKCPRYNKEEDKYLLFDLELMFGKYVYKQCAFNIEIPYKCISNKIIIPYPQCNFNTNKDELMYSMVPRECVWNITIFGMNEDKNNKHAIAFGRIPLINEKHCLHKNKKLIYLYSIPKNNKIFDMYSCYNGISYPQNLKKSKGKLKGKSKKPVSITVDFFYDKYKFDVVAPIINEQNVLNINNNKKLMNNISFESLYTYLNNINWLNKLERIKCYNYLFNYSCNNNNTENYEDFICLLNENFMDNSIRLFAISQLNKLDDYTLNKYLFELIEILKIEISNESFLSRFLIYRALQNPYQIGHYLFWHLKSQLFIQPFYYERFALLIEEYLYYSPIYIKHNMFKQHNLMNNLKIIAANIRQKRHNKSHKDIKKIFKKQLVLLNNQIFQYENENKNNKLLIQFPLNPLIKIKRIKISKCSIESNKNIILTFITNTNKLISIIFRYSDNLKYEMLISNLISIMDVLWLKNNLDLKIKTYSVIQTGSKTGIIEIISDSKQIKNDPMDIHSIFEHDNNDEKQIETEIENQRNNYARSCVGYCMITCILGINIHLINYKNIHILNNGQLFYINFIHSLFQNKVYYQNIKQPPFVFTNYMKFAIDKQSSLYQQFEIWMFNAFCILRNRYKLFENLLLLSNLNCKQIDDIIAYVKSDLKDKLAINLKNSKVKTRVHMQDTLNVCLNYNYTNQIE